MKTGRTLTELAAEIERQSKTKKDYIAPLTAVSMVATEGKPQLHIEGKGQFGIGEIAHGQIASHTKIDKRYYDKMKIEAPELLATNVGHWFRKFPAPQMLRTLDGNVRALLSDKFNTLDNHDFAEAALPMLLKRKMTIMSCEITERRLYIKAVDEALFRDVPVGYKMGDGSHQLFDTCAPAIILANSEVGYGRLVVETGVYTRACTNLCLFANGGMKRQHVGARHRLIEEMAVSNLEDILSDAAKKKTMEALWLQVRDVVNSAFDEKVVKARVDKLEEAAGRKITKPVDKVLEVVQERFSLNDGERDSILRNLIDGKLGLTQYGLHAAITRSAQDLADYDRATEMEYLGGKVVELKRNEWADLAEAA